MESVGERLKKIRLEKGITLEEVHKKTKIHLNILEELEEGRLINKSPLYVKGFIKLYCNFLGVNPEEFIEGFKKPELKTEYTEIYQKPILPAPKIKLSMFKPHFKIIRALVTLVLLLVLGIGAVNLVKAHKKSAAVSLHKKAKGKILATPSQVPSEIIRVGIRARQDCWIKARVDGKVLFADVLRKGRFENWQAKEKIELSLGNAAGIDLELNGKIISPLGRRGQVIRHIVISQEGLKIIR